MKDHPKTQHKNCLERGVVFGPVYLNQNRKSRVENKFVLKEEWCLLNMIFPQVPLCPNLPAHSMAKALMKDHPKT